MPDIQIVLNVSDNGSISILDQAGNAMEGMGGKAASASGGMGGMVSGMADMVSGAMSLVGGLQTAVGMISAVNEMGVSALRTRDTLNTLSKGNAPAYISAMAEATHGLLDDTTLAAEASKMLSTGIASSAEQAANLARDGATLGLAFGGDAAGGVDKLTKAMEGVGNGRALKDLNIDADAVKRRFDELKKTMSDKEAWDMAVLSGADARAKELAGTLDSTGTATERFGVALNNLKTGAVENVATGLEAIVGGLTAITAHYLELDKTVDQKKAEAAKAEADKATQANSDRIAQTITALPGDYNPNATSGGVSLPVNAQNQNMTPQQRIEQQNAQDKTAEVKVAQDAQDAQYAAMQAKQAREVAQDQEYSRQMDDAAERADRLKDAARNSSEHRYAASRAMLDAGNVVTADNLAATAKSDYGNGHGNRSNYNDSNAATDAENERTQSGSLDLDQTQRNREKSHEGREGRDDGANAARAVSEHASAIKTLQAALAGGKNAVADFAAAQRAALEPMNQLNEAAERRNKIQSISDAFGVKQDSFSQEMTAGEGSAEAAARAKFAAAEKNKPKAQQDADLAAYDGRAKKAQDDYAIATGQATKESIAFRDAQTGLNTSLSNGQISVEQYYNKMKALGDAARDGKTSLKDIDDVMNPATAVPRGKNRNRSADPDDDAITGSHDKALKGDDKSAADKKKADDPYASTKKSADTAKDSVNQLTTTATTGALLMVTNGAIAATGPTMIGTAAERAYEPVRRLGDGLDKLVRTITINVTSTSGGGSSSASKGGAPAFGA